MDLPVSPLPLEIPAVIQVEKVAVSASLPAAADPNNNGKTPRKLNNNPLNCNSPFPFREHVDLADFQGI